MAARIRSLCLTMLFCSLTKAGMRQRRAQEIHRCSAAAAAAWLIWKISLRPSLRR